MSKPEYTFCKVAEACNWNDASQAGVLMAFVMEKGLLKELDAFVSEHYAWELEEMEEMEEVDQKECP
jgi:hypothetical protein